MYKNKGSALKLRRDLEIHILNYYQDLTVTSGLGDQAHIVIVMVKPSQ